MAITSHRIQTFLDFKDGDIFVAPVWEEQLEDGTMAVFPIQNADLLDIRKSAVNINTSNGRTRVFVKAVVTRDS